MCMCYPRRPLSCEFGPITRASCSSKSTHTITRLDRYLSKCNAHGAGSCCNSNPRVRDCRRLISPNLQLRAHAAGSGRPCKLNDSRGGPDRRIYIDPLERNADGNSTRIRHRRAAGYCRVHCGTGVPHGPGPIRPVADCACAMAIGRSA